MEDPTIAGRESEHSAFSWLELATGFWDEVSKIITDTQIPTDKKNPLPSNEDSFKNRYRTYQIWKTGFKNINSFVQMMTRQDNREAVSESMVTFFELLTQITGDSSENLLEFQQHILNSISRVGEHTKAYNFDDLDHRIFESLRKLYEYEFQKYIYVPKLGLPRFYLERISALIDKFNIHYSYLSELIYLFFVPIEKTNRIIQAEIEEMMRHKDFVEDSDALYNEWVKMLEGHYMKLLQSAEYTEVLKKTIDSLSDYRKSKDEVLYLILKMLPIPTNKEMDDVYRELYMMKKQIRELTDQMNQLSNR